MFLNRYEINIYIGKENHIVWVCEPQMIAHMCRHCSLCGIAVKAMAVVRHSLNDPFKNLTNQKKSDPCLFNWIGVNCIYDRNDAYQHILELYVFLFPSLSCSLAFLLPSLYFLYFSFYILYCLRNLWIYFHHP